MKKPQDAYKFCPRCGAPLSSKQEGLLSCANNHHIYINPCPTVGVIIINDKDEILLVRRGVDPKKGLWDVAGGFIEVGESLEEGLRREIQEELGVTIEIMDFMGGFAHEEYETDGVFYPILGLFFTAKIQNGAPVAKDDVSEFRFFKQDNISLETIAFDDVRQALKKFLKVR